jgi:hypothetical protein
MISCLAIVAHRTEAQTQTGAQILRTARSVYDQGRLHELPALLEDHLAKNHFQSDVEIVEAYKILVLTFIYLEEPQKADEAMLQILRTEFFFEPNASDPIEFKNLYSKFRVKPIYSYGVKVGAAVQTFVRPVKNNFVNGESQGYGEYNPNLTIHFTGVFEKELTFKLGGKKIENFVINPELSYTSQSFNYFNDHLSFSDGTEPAFADHKIQHTRIQLNALVRYRIGKFKLNPYVSLGPSIGYLLGSSFDGQLAYEFGNGKTQSGLDNSDSYKPLNYSLIVSGGFKYKISGIYLTGDIRYQYGLVNVVDGANRYNLEGDRNTIITEYGYIDNDFSIDQLIINVGLIIPKFNPKKLIK